MTKWSDERLSVMADFYITNGVRNDQTLDWCHNNFEGANGKRYDANKRAYEHHLESRVLKLTSSQRALINKKWTLDIDIPSRSTLTIGTIMSIVRELRIRELRMYEMMAAKRLNKPEEFSEQDMNYTNWLSDRIKNYD